jgi:hypothetical protein
VDADGAPMDEAPAQAQTDWTEEGPVPFRAELAFTVTQDTPATIVLRAEDAAGTGTPEERRIPVVLVPPGAAAD